MASFMSTLAEAPPVPIFHLTAKYNADPHSPKLNLGVGAYQDENGKPWVLPVVKRMESLLNDDLQAGKLNKEYLPVGGLAAFVTASAALALGAQHPAILENRVDGVQCLSGTGSLRMAFEFISRFSAQKDVYVSEPTWDNHFAIIKACGLSGHAHRYYNEHTRGLDFAGLLADIATMPAGATILLHACAHNPTGVDPSEEQWREIAAAVKARKLFVIMDSAYQGFASGDPDRDARAIRIFADAGIVMLVCQSYAKNFGLYSERAGCLTVVAESAAVARAATSQIKVLVRANWSTPPTHGALIVAGVLNNPALRAEWMENIRTMSTRIALMRKLLRAALEAKKCPGSWQHIVDQIGMFSYTGLSPAQVQLLVEKYHIYLPTNGRINMCGVTEPMIDYLAAAITDAVSNIPAANL